MRTIAALPHIGGLRPQADADSGHLRKRNTVEYTYTGGATDKEADELIEFTREFQKDLIRWLHANHPDLV